MPTALPSELYRQLTHAFDQRAWLPAKELAARLLSIAPRHPVVNYIAGIACMEVRQFATALKHLHIATSMEPARADFAVHFAKALSLARRNVEAKVAADRARPLAVGDAAMLDTLGVIYTQLGEYTSAAWAFRAAVGLAPGHAPFRYNLSTSLIAAGDIDAAEIELEACLEVDPRHWLAHLTLAQLRRQTTAHNHVARLESLLQGIERVGASDEALMCLNMALAKEKEDLADYANAFGHLVRGKAAGAAQRKYSIKRDEALFAAITAAFPEPMPSAAGCDSHEPIFIIGMPRTGTTLVERIISSHPDVQSAGELLNFGMSLKHLSGCRSPAMVDEQTIVALAQPDWRKLGETYLASTRPGTGRKPRFIDKLPHNFLYAGYIARALPNAKIVCLRRDPMDTCLSNFRQLFAPQSPFFGYSFDLYDTGRYYVLFDRLMTHWRNTFPGRILEINYEAIVNSQESSSRQLLQHCGLSWTDACLQFQHNPTPVATASAVQVRTPIFRSSMQRWRHYEQQLIDLRALLLDAGVYVPA
ncbi:MAG: sulfotransferase [Rhodanobacter sp.]|nr:sulfotransferase [Rhodanobacter sp.]ODT90044.1 MAG: sulfotransferase [Rhodanobacter sp. SCN 67-45]OJW30392.1 MAG: sulfotransferase [Rhodanobacter sp. 67-28]